MERKPMDDLQENNIRTEEQKVKKTATNIRLCL